MTDAPATTPRVPNLPTPRGAAASQATTIEQTRAIAEVQAAIFVAQQFPRDIQRAEAEMRDACGRSALAKRAFYRVTNRGNGPSVHLARELIRIWGNSDYGVRELHRDDEAGTSEVLAYAWDQQTNTRSTRTFIVPHQRMAKDDHGRPIRRDLVDLQDVYLNNQNVGARAVRECIFTVLPDWYVEAAQDLARKTLEDGDGVPLPQRIEQAIAAFGQEFGVKQDQLEAKLGRRRGQWDAGDVATMQILYGSLRRGEVTLDEEFTPAAPTVASITSAAPQVGGGAGPVEPVAGVPAPGETPPAPEGGGPQPPPAPSSGTPQPDPNWGRRMPSQRQMAALHAVLRELGITTDDAIHAWCSEQLHTGVTSRKDLGSSQVNMLIELANAQVAQAQTDPPKGSPSP